MNCSIDGCNNPAKCRGWCSTHYSRWYRNGDLSGKDLSGKDQTKLEWLEERLQQPFGAECVEWPFAKVSHGYGVFWAGNKMWRVSHFVLESDGRPRPGVPQNNSLHSCDNPPCFNPNHLRWGTLKENTADIKERGRRQNTQGENHPNAKIAEHDVHVIFALSRLGHSPLDISKMFGMDRGSIYQILSGRAWAHLGLATAA